MEKMKLELEMLKQNEIDKQREHEQKILEVEFEVKGKRKRGRPKKTWKTQVEKQSQRINREQKSFLLSSQAAAYSQAAR